MDDPNQQEIGRESSAGARPKLLARLRQVLAARHYSPCTAEAYAGWVRRFVRFHHSGTRTS